MTITINVYNVNVTSYWEAWIMIQGGTTHITTGWRTRAQALVAAFAWVEEWEVCQRHDCGGNHHEP